MINPIHKTTYFYTPQAYAMSSLPEVTVVYQTLTHAQVNSLSLLYENKQHNEYAYRICEFGIIRIESINGELLNFSKMPTLFIQEIAKEIMSKSTITVDELEEVSTNLDIYLSDALSAESWKCEVCKQKKLQANRNCGFINEQDKNKDFKLFINKKIYTHCPIFSLNKEAISVAIDAYNIFKSKFLPDAGGWFDQTQTFCTLAILSNNKFEERNRIEMEKQIKASKGS